MTFIDWSVGEPWTVADSSVTGCVCYFRSSGFGITLWSIPAAAPEGGVAYRTGGAQDRGIYYVCVYRESRS